MRKHDEFIFKNSGILVIIHWYTQLYDTTDQSNAPKMVVH